MTPTDQLRAYASLLKRPEWEAFSKKVKSRDGYACACCGQSNGPLHAHHRQYHRDEKTREYKLPWKYSLKVMITLCELCHTKGHQKYKVPVFFV